MMKIYILLILVISLGISSCTNPNEKEIGEVEALLAIMEETEQSLLSIDTSIVFEAKRQMDKDITEVSSFTDTMTREDAFKLDDIFRTRKRFNKITINYSGFIYEIEFSRNQLNNLKEDLENGLINKEDFKAHYAKEKEYVMVINNQISKVIGGLDEAIEKQKLDRPSLLEIIEKKKLKTVLNE